MPPAEFVNFVILQGRFIRAFNASHCRWNEFVSEVDFYAAKRLSMRCVTWHEIQSSLCILCT